MACWFLLVNLNSSPVSVSIFLIAASFKNTGVPSTSSSIFNRSKAPFSPAAALLVSSVNFALVSSTLFVNLPIVFNDPPNATPKPKPPAPPIAVSTAIRLASNSPPSPACCITEYNAASGTAAVPIAAPLAILGTLPSILFDWYSLVRALPPSKYGVNIRYGSAINAFTNSPAICPGLVLTASCNAPNVNGILFSSNR